MRDFLRAHKERCQYSAFGPQRSQQRSWLGAVLSNYWPNSVQLCGSLSTIQGLAFLPVESLEFAL